MLLFTIRRLGNIGIDVGYCRDKAYLVSIRLILLRVVVGVAGGSLDLSAYITRILICSLFANCE